MAIVNKSSVSDYGAAYTFKKEEEAKNEYSLEDLRDDDEFVKVAERFLEELGEGDNVSDLYQYFRGSDWNVADTGKVARQAGKFTDQQKQDYNYLRTKFDNANVGGLREKAQLGIDATQELLSDPLNWLSAIAIPWTSGTSMFARLAGGEATKQALKGATNLGIRKSLGKLVLNTPGQVLKGPLSTKQLLAVASAEGLIYGGTHNYVNQSIDLNAGRREERDYLETAAAGAIGAVAAPTVLLGLKGLGKVPKWVNSVNEQRIAKIDHNENYQNTYFEEGVSNLVEGLKTTAEVVKLFALPIRPTTFLRKKAKENELLQSLLGFIRYDAMEGFMSPPIGKQNVLKPDYDAAMRKLQGRFTERLNKILGKDGWNLKEHQNRFTSKDKKNWLMNPGLSDAVNDDLSYFIRSGKSFKTVEGQQVKLADNIIGAGKEIRKELDDIYRRAKKAGLNPNRATNYFPRGWRVDVIKKNKKEFIDKIIKAEKISNEAAESLWLKITTEGTPESGTTAGLRTRLTSERLLTKLDDAEFGKFLNNDVEGVLKQYYGESSALITRTRLFGETEEDFIERWITPIKKSGLDLTEGEETYLKLLYGIITGQKGRINRSKKDPYFGKIPIGEIGAGFHDLMTVTMQTSMLGLSTLTSFAEIGVPLLLGNESKIGGKAIGRAIVDSGKEWWGTQKQNFGVGDANIDVRGENRRALNSFMLSVNMAGEDRAVAIYGQAVGKTATKIQNMFFKTIGLHDWTRFVQLVGYDMGKKLIHKNLQTLSTKAVYPITGAERKALKVKGVGYDPETARLRIRDELSELGVNVDNGLKWLERGGLHTDQFYMQDVRAAATRYTNEVVMNPTAASAQKPLVHSLAGTKWAYGLMGFPTAFSNGPLRRVIRNITRDAKTISSGGLRISSGRAATGALFMTSIGLLNYTLRTGGRNFEDLESGKITEYEMLERSLQYAGILGLGEYYVRYAKAGQYESKIAAAIGSVVGPNLPDLIEYTTKFWERGVLAETVLRRAPFSVTLKSLHPELYKKWLDYARELDKQTGLSASGPDNVEPEVRKSGDKFFSTGGLVEGEDTVPYTKEDPADRVNPYTGEPYQEQMDRLGFNIGGVLARQLIKRSLPASKPAQQKILKETSDISKAGIQDKDLLTEYKKNVDDIWELEQKGLGDEGDKLYERQDALQEQMQEVGNFYKKEYTHTQNFDVNNPSVYRTGEYKLVKIDRDPYYTGSEDVVYKLNPEKYTKEEVKNQIIKLLDENLLIKDDQHIDVKTLIKVASNNSSRDSTILKTLDKNDMLWIDSPGGYYKQKLYSAAKTLYTKGDKYPTKSGKNMLPFEKLAREGVGNYTFIVGTNSKPFFVNPNKLDNLINFSSSNKDYFRHRLEFNREQFLDELTNLKDRVMERGYFGRGTSSHPIQIEVSRFGDVIIPEGNHRLALALISKQEEVPIILYYKQGAERLKTNLSIDNLSSLLDKGKTGYKTNKEFGILKRKVNKQFKNVEAYTDEYVKKQGYALGGKVSTNEQMDRLGFDNGGETSGPPKFEKRIARPDPEMFIKDPESGNPQTHRMGWGKIDGKFIAYPTIVEENGKLVQYENNIETMGLMKKSGNYKAFDTKEEAEAYADGSWKTKEFNKTYRKGFNEGTIFGTIKDSIEKASEIAANTVNKLKTERQEPSPEDTQRVNNFLFKHYDRFKTQYPEMSDVSFEQFKDSAQRLAANVRKIESDNNNIELGFNKLNSSATGKYQFLRDSVDPAINRTLRRMEPKDKNLFDGIRESKDTSKLNDEAQQLLFYGDMFEKTGSDKHLVPYFLGDEQAGKNAYLYQHHTLSSKVPEYNQETIDRTNKLWNSPE